MRFGVYAVGASLCAHLALMAILDGIDADPERPARPAPVRVSLTTAPRAGVSAPSAVPHGPVTPAPPPLVVEPIAIELVAPVVTTPPPPAPAPAPALAPAVAAPTQRGAPRSPAAPTGPAIATGAAPALEPGAELAPGGEPVGPARPGIFTMRRGAIPDLDPSNAIARLGLDGGRPPPAPIVPSGELAPSGGGTFATEHGGFTAQVGKNGSVAFTDKPAFSFGLAVPNPKVLAKAAARGLENWYDDPAAGIRAADVDPGREPPRPVGGGAPEQKDLPAPMVSVPLLGGSSEITDWVMRKAGMDPYASAKRDYLDATREERIALRLTNDARELARTVQTMRKNLQRAWARADLPAAERRAALFELWDECVEDGDEEVVDAGNQARAAVVGFVRAHLPAGSPDAFTADELAALNRRRTSKAPFAPY